MKKGKNYTLLYAFRLEMEENFLIFKRQNKLLNLNF